MDNYTRKIKILNDLDNMFIAYKHVNLLAKEHFPIFKVYFLFFIFYFRNLAS